ncbi:2-C-methyl-D-erythritol 2,4-cyclodiphosphate synthase [Aliibacillus thermotolerans]|uniref:2-C-methyl-D-erythritol 2,4-cyclodiphosphate synthase n=1 Tax=Aliibacillus thermotolerans TaxID=1834418 RepID=A0ABW0UAX3_9BACI|nr:2-C-methyl-D-erythritol 2,4-cyclodiphosphate synthase [Aliibacillus thermotolerans]MDA3128892.1 2-C-methyl-D-erythritol 2,4-cyclodiphosphate synthase [Aliibacillus thermotolerans]
MRIGHGYDVHQFSENRPLIVGGVRIPYKKGLLGHSDADVLLHAVTDALLGAIGKGDIGTHFPDTDPTFKDANSLQLLKKVYELVKNEGYQIGNVDATVLAEKPKMKPYIPEMKKHIANALEAVETQVNVKATTSEKLGFVGKEEGMAAHAVVLLKRKA